MDKIPTAVEFLSSKGIVTNKSSIITPKVAKYLEEYSKLKAEFYVKAALAAAAKNADLIETDGYIDPDTILNAYPLNLIK